MDQATTQLLHKCVNNALTLLVRGLSMRGLPFSLVWAHLRTETQGLRDQVALNLDSMVDSDEVWKVCWWRSVEEDKTN